MATLTDDAGETSGNIPHPRSDFGNDRAYNGLRTRFVPLSLPTNMTKLRKQGQTTSNVVTPKLVNARYCENFVHVLWKDGSTVHIQVPPQVYRRYKQQMEACLSEIERRIDWLRRGSRELFGTIMEDDVGPS
ncbi:unnamed protein product [Protopolystoma xenopodis]|uniref:Uncharacterized protein n=1 Tax=Protopolystoma xenopodis TaxID=117903 RepID=A0A448WRU6_9PLAT|nr:unnamed protein product [Protopolystoma xenopodis]